MKYDPCISPCIMLTALHEPYASTLMPTRPVPFLEVQRTRDTWAACLLDGWKPSDGNLKNSTISAVTELLRRLGKTHGSRPSVENQLDTAVALGLNVPQWREVDGEWVQRQRLRYQSDPDYCAASGAARPSHPLPSHPLPSHPPPSPTQPNRPVMFPHRPVPDQVPLDPVLRSPPAPRDESPGRGSQITSQQLAEQVVRLLRRTPSSIDTLAAALKTEPAYIPALLVWMQASGTSLTERGGMWYIDAAPPMGSQRDANPARELVSSDAGVIRIAAVGDMHLGSKYTRLDCLHDFYDQVVVRGISVVLNAGNWIDGEAEFNKHDLLVHGMDAQMRYLATHYPRRPGVATWAIAGADHEGWYARREGVDVGRYAERVMRDAGREDWHDLGYMECFVPLRHGATGKTSRLCLMHPGGGSAYALSYAPQKIVEGFDGGDKPSVLLIGHYHKSGYNLIRNVHTMQVGTFQDQTLFMRQKKLAAHVGGCFLELRLDPETGAVIECAYSFRNYFVRDYYNGRWSQHGDVQHASRSPEA